MWLSVGPAGQIVNRPVELFLRTCRRADSGSLDNSIRQDAQLLGIGPTARALLMQSVGGAGRDASAVHAAQERLRKRVTGAAEEQA
jgi:hypothetical protein